MVLPEGFQKKSTKQYEEISIPAVRSDLKFDQPLVQIKDLDKVRLVLLQQKLWKGRFPNISNLRFSSSISICANT